MGEERAPTAIAPPAAPAPAPSPLGDLVARAMARRPELRVLGAAGVEADERVRAAQSEHLPVLRAYGSAGVARWNNALTDDVYAAAGIGLALPIFQGFAVDARERRARLARARRRAELEEERLRVRAEVASARERLLGALELVGRGRVEVQAALEASRLARERYLAGLLPLVDLQNAEVLRTAAELHLAASETAAHAAAAVLRFATGEPRRTRLTAPQVARSKVSTPPETSASKATVNLASAS
jgi:outer membrane protein